MGIAEHHQGKLISYTATDGRPWSALHCIALHCCELSDGPNATQRNARGSEELVPCDDVHSSLLQMDKASIIKDAIEYIQQLQSEERQVLQEVESASSGKLKLNARRR